MKRFIFLLAMLSPALVFAAAPTKPFELRDGDRVVFLGDTLMEREKDFGYIELMMTLRFPDRNVTFRNLGWSADTPVGISRVSFDWPKGEGEMFRQLMTQIKQVQPTVVVLGYGMASSLEDAAATEMEGRASLSSARRGEATGNPTRVSDSRRGEDTAALPASGKTARLDKFVTDYNKLIDAILELNKETRFILLSPIRHEKLPPPLPDPARHNEFLASYTKAIQGIAEKRGYSFVDLFNHFSRTLPNEPATFIDNGITWRGRPEPEPVSTDNGIHLNKRGYWLLAHSVGAGLGWTDAALGQRPWLRTAEHEDLRAIILKKNELFFNRWRPENTTYLFLFRKHEQGKNAQEIPKFDPLIQAEEEKIAKLRKEPPKSAGEVRIPGFAERQNFQSASHLFTLSELQKPKQVPVTEHPATPFKEQPPVHFILADTNLEVTLWAENPLLAKPIAMNWDARGRLWIASSSVYPQIEPGQAQDDKILVLEDTNGDGKADKTTVFADGLLIPTGVEPGDGGCYVGQSTELLHFKDTDGDGIADQRRVVLSGFGTEDTHHILHTLRWGPDGQLYMNQSIYIHSHIETPNGVVRLNSGGTLALRPDTMELGVTMKGLVNGWGHVWDDFGQEFQTDGAGGEGINWNIPQAMFVTYEGARRVLHSVSPGAYPKFCSLELIKSERFPKEWQGNAITCDFRANRIVRFEITEQGAGYTTKQHEFLRSTNITFRPIDVKMGPDGALYIADWSNPIIQHGEVDFRDPRRDRVHGRIWRVGYKAGKDVKAVELVKATNKELLDQLLSPNEANRKQAYRLIVERAQKKMEERTRVVDDLREFIERNINNDTALLHSMWICASIDTPSLAMSATHGRGGALAIESAAIPGLRAKYTPVIPSLLEISDPRIRAASIRVLGIWSGNTPGIPSLANPRIDPSTALNLLAKRITDDHPRVRIEALRALARIPTARSAELALSVLDAPRSGGRQSAADPKKNGGRLPSAATELDPWLEYALWLTINDLAEPWAAAVESGEWKIEGREKQLQYALKAIEPKLATRLMTKVVGDKPLPRDGSGGMIELIGQAGGPQQLRKLFDQVLANGFTDEAMARALNQLAEAARLRNARPSGDLSAIVKLLDGTTPHPNPLPVEGRGDQTSAPKNLNAQGTTGAANISPSPLNGERAGVRGGTLPAAAKLAGIWRLASAAPALNKLASDAATPVSLRTASIEGLRDLGGRDSVNALRSLTKDKDASIQRSAAAALAATDLNRSMPQILEVVSATTKEDEALPLWRSLLAARGASAAFTKALATNSLPEEAARAGLRVAREGGRTEPNLVLALNRAGGISDPTAALTENEIHSIAYEVTKGNPANGEKLYRNKQLGCMLCHSIGGAGGKVGPDMTSLGASTPLADYLVESVLLPNKKVKEGFNSVQITTKDDEEVSGNLVREDNEQVILRDATNREISVPKRNIKDRRMGGSLMPAGLLDFISPQERLDVYAFLAQLGKPGAYDATKQNVARVWRLNPKVGTVNADEMLKSDIRTSKDWTPMNATVSGALPKADIMEELQGNDATVWIASRFQTVKSGPTHFTVSGTASPKAWIDGKPIGGDSELTVDLPAGQHTFFLKVTTSDITQGLKLESNDATFLVE